MPSAVTYPGMPASRWWEFEDSRVDFGAVEAQPEDLGRLLLAEFALVYGVNWLIVPLEVPIGTLVRITSLGVRDTFGRSTTIGPTAPSGQWQMFGLARADGLPDGALLIAPSLGASLQGRDVEEVLLLRVFASRWPWLGAGLALLLALPNLIWQAQNGFATVEFLRLLRQDVLEHQGRGLFLAGQLLYFQPFATLVWGAGLASAFGASGRAWRPFAVLFLAMLIVFFVVGGKPYYPASAYPPLLAAGGVVLEQRLAPHALRF